ncbi:MAG: ComEC/Rec2 family competence protein [Acidobacteriota bacterium]|nr:ComEC/Rec2 family competence protein [Acidobacteriota bacterium]
MRQSSGTPRPESESESARERRLWPRATRVEPLRFRASPLLAAAVYFALGEALTCIPPAPARPTALLLTGTIALLALTLFALRRTPRIAVFAVAALWIATGLWSAQIQPSPSPQTALLNYADGLSRTVEAGVVRIRPLPPRSTTDSDAEPTNWDNPAEVDDAPAATSLDLSLTAIEDVTPDTSRMVPIAGGVRATLSATSATQPQLQCGDLVSLPLRLHTPERYYDPGAWQYADYLLDQNIAATASASAAKLSILPAQRADFAATLHCRIFAAQTWAAGRLLGYVRSTPNRRLPALLRITPDDAGMLNAMLFGDRTRLTHTLRLGFERTGSFHLFVVSGMHVALLAGILFWLARRLRFSPALATLVTLGLISAYALVTGFGVPVERALLMTSVFLIARLLSRQRNSLNALGAAALAVLVWSPRALFEASFQMTFLAIVAIAGITMPLAERSFLPYARATRNLRHIWEDATLPPRLAQFRMMLRLWSEALATAVSPRVQVIPAAFIRATLFVAELALIGIIAEAVMILPMALVFHRVTVFALPANIFSIPLVAVLAPLGLVTFLASLINPYVAALPASALALLLHAISGLIQRISHVQAAEFRVPGPTLPHALLALGCFAFCCWAVRRSRAFAWIAVAVLPLAAAIILWPSPPDVHLNQLEATAIDVGQGDSILIVSPNGRAMLIDAGGPTGAAANAENAAAAQNAFDIGDQIVSPYLWSRQIRRLDVVALSHAHSDHMGGMPAILRNFRPRELWVAVDPDSDPFRALLAEAATLGIRVRHLRAGDRLDFDSIPVTVLAPTPAYNNSGPPTNNDSLVLRMQFDRASALFEGDAEVPSERAMASASLTNPNLRLGPDTLLKVGHHGSRTSTTPEFLALAAPQDAVISVGANNTFGHPRPEIIDRLYAAHAHVFRTDRSGLTTFLLSRDGRIAVLPPASNQ